MIANAIITHDFSKDKYFFSLKWKMLELHFRFYIYNKIFL